MAASRWWYAWAVVVGVVALLTTGIAVHAAVERGAIVGNALAYHRATACWQRPLRISPSRVIAGHDLVATRRCRYEIASIGSKRVDESGQVSKYYLTLRLSDGSSTEIQIWGVPPKNALRVGQDVTAQVWNDRITRVDAAGWSGPTTDSPDNPETWNTLYLVFGAICAVVAWPCLFLTLRLARRQRQRERLSTPRLVARR